MYKVGTIKKKLSCGKGAENTVASALCALPVFKVRGSHKDSYIATSYTAFTENTPDQLMHSVRDSVSKRWVDFL